jgi:glyoxylase-like metal-dependent hydrolase (beta-lactamase superfamily II)
MEELQFGPVHFIPGDNYGRYPFCHSLYIEGTRRIVIDPASHEARLRALRDGPGVDEVWLSHYHEDHFLFLPIFDGVPLALSEADAGALASIENLLDYYDITNPEDRRAWEEFMKTYFSFRPRRADRYLVGGQVIDLGGVTVEVIATPGHTAGHLSFFFREPAVLFVGDYDLSPFPYYGDRDSDIDETIASVRRLREVPARVLVCPHDSGVHHEGFDRLWDRFLAVIEDREARLIELLAARPRTMADIVEARIVYKKAREPKLFYDYGEMYTMRKHLTRLIGRGLVRLEGEYYSLSAMR